MKTKLFTFFLVFASVEIMFAEKVQIGGLYYNLDADTQTAEVTYESQYFGNYSGLTSVDIPTTVTYNDVTYSITSIGSNAFSGCNLTSVTIPNSVTSIGESAFVACRNLTLIEIPHNVTDIGSQAFRDCDGLTSMTIPNSVTTIETRAFYHCINLTSLTIGNSVTSIGENVFQYCVRLTSVTIPNSVTSIGSYVFNGCTGIISPVYNAHVFAFMPPTYSGAYTIPDGIESIAGGAFYNCVGLTTVTIPNSVTSIGEYAFDGCTGLISPVYNAHVFAFMPPTYSGAYTIPDGIESIAGAAFYRCTGLTSVTIPNSITSIREQAFYQCSNLTSLTLGNSVTSIEMYAFSGCYNLSSVTCETITPPTIRSNTFSTESYSAILYVPEGSVDAYQNAFCWKNFTNIRVIVNAPLVQFLDWDGTVLSSANVATGTAASPPANPSREGYTFIGWDKDFSNITEDLTITALYKINRYKVDFVDWDETVLKSDSVDWSSAAIAPVNPSREGYTFIGWDKEFGNVTTDLIVNAQYEIGVNTDFTINFTTKDGDEIISNLVILKVLAAPEIVGFTFIGWRPVADIIVGNTIEIEAVYEANELTSAPEVVNPSNHAQKLIRDGNVYILKGDKTYTIQGQEVK